MAQHRDHLLGASFPTSLLVVAQGHLKTELTFRNWKTSLKNPDSLLLFKNKRKKKQKSKRKELAAPGLHSEVGWTRRTVSPPESTPHYCPVRPQSRGAGTTYLRCAVDILMAENTSLYSKASKQKKAKVDERPTYFKDAGKTSTARWVHAQPGPQAKKTQTVSEMRGFNSWPGHV